jgi:hypothetical protein
MNVYDVPLVSPVNVAVSVEPLTVTISPPGLAITLYSVITDPPLDAGAAHVTSACVLPPVAVTLVGVSVTVTGLTAAVDAGVGVRYGVGVADNSLLDWLPESELSCWARSITRAIAPKRMGIPATDQNSHLLHHETLRPPAEVVSP